ncbi:RDD family protein [Lacibacterium aquatile]|uniref:RDD family protein n=1 Tax=Lacibacterium aquatile TaxID=1168082 RepID=A0ABW5DMM7_9PROT
MQDGGQWWYLDGDVRRGPYAAAEMEKLFEAAILTLETPVWREGMGEPQRFADQPELGGKIRARDVKEQRTAPWSRWVARQIDMLLWMVPPSLIAVYVTDGYWEGHPVGVLFLLGFACLSVIFLAALLIDALVLWAFGTTPGKWWYRLSVRNKDGGRIPLIQLIRRNLSIWLYGYGLNLPFFDILALWFSYRRAAQGKPCIWDEIERHDVRQQPVGGWWWFAGLVVLLVLPFGLAKIDLPRPSPWTNPLSGVAVRIPPGWALVDSFTTPQGQGFTFKARGGLEGYLIQEIVPNQSLADYAEQLQQRPVYGMFRSSRLHVAPDGKSYIKLAFSQGEGRSASDIDLWVWQGQGGSFWHVAVFQPVSDSDARLEGRKLAEILGKSGLAPGPWAR